jgi:hypothetical protein
MRSRYVTVLLGLGLFLSLPFISLTFIARAAAETLTGADGHIELQLPDGWHGQTPDQPGWLKASNQNRYVLVISENKDDFVDINAYGELVTKQMVKRLQGGEASAPQQITVGGRPALRYDIFGTIDNGLRIGYLLTVVETQHRFSQVLGWTLRSEFDTHKDELGALANGLREAGDDGR